MNISQALTIYLLMLVCSFVVEVGYAKLYYALTKTHYKEHPFAFGKYFFWLLFPVLTTVFVATIAGLSLAYIIVAFAAIGTLLEWLVGWSYHRVVGQRLWTYHRYALGGYTSLLSIPVWGLAGGLFWLLAKVFI